MNKLSLAFNFQAMICLCFACVFVCQLGCGESKKSLHEIDHTTPAHWPADLQDAAEKIRERLQAVQGEGSGSDSSLALKELSDLVGWIPEVAADTDLVEAQWNKLYEASEVARKQLTSAKQISPELASQIETLCTLLVESAKLLTKPSESQSPSVTELIAN